jgi:hypothetical protein
MIRHFYYLLLFSTILLAGTACQQANSFSLWQTVPGSTPTLAANGPRRYPVNPVAVESNLDQLSAYRAKLILDFEGERSGQPSQGHIELLRAVNRPAATLHYAIEVQGTIPNAHKSLGSAEFFQVGDKVYIKRETEKFWFETKPGSHFSPGAIGLLEPERLLILPATVATPPTFETFNGLEVQRYHFTQADLSTPNLVFDRAEGDIWVSIAGRIVFQYSISTTARIVTPLPNATLFDTGHLSLNYTLLDLNNSLELTPPPLDETISAPLAALPRLPDAQITTVFPTLIEYTSVVSPLSATLFYQKALYAQGWAEETMTVFNEKANLNFSKEQQVLTVIINPDQTPEKIKVSMNLHSAR